MTKEKPTTFVERQKKYINDVEKALAKNPDIYNFCDLPLIVPYSRALLYEYQIDKLDSIKEALQQNKMDYKRKLRKEMKNTKNPTCLIALYKLVADKEERDALNNKSEAVVNINAPVIVDDIK